MKYTWNVRHFRCSQKFVRKDFWYCPSTNNAVECHIGERCKNPNSLWNKPEKCPSGLRRNQIYQNNLKTMGLLLAFIRSLMCIENWTLGNSLGGWNSLKFAHCEYFIGRPKLRWCVDNWREVVKKHPKLNSASHKLEPSKLSCSTRRGWGENRTIVKNRPMWNCNWLFRVRRIVFWQGRTWQSRNSPSTAVENACLRTIPCRVQNLIGSS